jgi:hypothetical protein
MNVIIRYALGLILSSVAVITFAQAPTTTIITPSQTVKWTSKNSSDVVTINNGSGNLLTITITVNKPAIAQTSPNSPSITFPGVNLTNCGNTTHIDAGSSGVCTTKDPSNPVSFNSDSPTYMATGTYSIIQK